MLRACARGLDHGVEAQLVTAPHMATSEFLRLSLVSAGDRRHDGLMLGQRFGDTPRRRERGAAKQDYRIVKILQALDQKSVMGCAVDVFMKDCIFARVDFRIVRQLGVQFQHCLEHVDFGGIGKPRGQRRCRALQSLAHIIELGHRAQIVLRHLKTAAGRMNQHAVGLQSTHRFANGRAADLEPGAQFKFWNALASLELPFLDGVPDCPIGLLGKTARRP